MEREDKGRERRKREIGKGKERERKESAKET